VTLRPIFPRLKCSQGFVTCIERMDAGDSHGRVMATNVFEKQGRDWKIIHHHGSPLPRLN